MAEVRDRVPAGARDRDRLVADLRAAIDDMDEAGELADVRVDEWWDPDDPEVWMRSVEGVRVRWTITVTDVGYEMSVRGPFAIHLRRPAALRILLDRLA